MKAMFGDIPEIFNRIPLHDRSSAWEWLKAMSNPDAAIPPKYGELIGLGVAAQIPCDFCIYAHTAIAIMYGAPNEKFKKQYSEEQKYVMGALF